MASIVKTKVAGTKTMAVSKSPASPKQTVAPGTALKKVVGPVKSSVISPGKPKSVLKSAGSYVDKISTTGTSAVAAKLVDSKPKSITSSSTVKMVPKEKSQSNVVTSSSDVLKKTERKNSLPGSELKRVTSTTPTKAVKSPTAKLNTGIKVEKVALNQTSVSTKSSIKPVVARKPSIAGIKDEKSNSVGTGEKSSSSGIKAEKSKIVKVVKATRVEKPKEVIKADQVAKPKVLVPAKTSPIAKGVCSGSNRVVRKGSVSGAVSLSRKNSIPISTKISKSVAVKSAGSKAVNKITRAVDKSEFCSADKNHDDLKQAVPVGTEKIVDMSQLQLDIKKDIQDVDLGISKVVQDADECPDVLEVIEKDSQDIKVEITDVVQDTDECTDLSEVVHHSAADEMELTKGALTVTDPSDIPVTVDEIEVQSIQLLEPECKLKSDEDITDQIPVPELYLEFANFVNDENIVSLIENEACAEDSIVSQTNLLERENVDSLDDFASENSCAPDMTSDDQIDDSDLRAVVARSSLDYDVGPTFYFGVNAVPSSNIGNGTTDASKFEVQRHNPFIFQTPAFEDIELTDDSLEGELSGQSVHFSDTGIRVENTSFFSEQQLNDEDEVTSQIFDTENEFGSDTSANAQSLDAGTPSDTTANAGTPVHDGTLCRDYCIIDIEENSNAVYSISASYSNRHNNGVNETIGSEATCVRNNCEKADSLQASLVLNFQNFRIADAFERVEPSNTAFEEIFGCASNDVQAGLHLAKAENSGVLEKPVLSYSQVLQKTFKFDPWAPVSNCFTRLEHSGILTEKVSNNEELVTKQSDFSNSSTFQYFHRNDVRLKNFQVCDDFENDYYGDERLVRKTVKKAKSGHSQQVSDTHYITEDDFSDLPRASKNFERKRLRKLKKKKCLKELEKITEESSDQLFLMPVWKSIWVDRID